MNNKTLSLFLILFFSIHADERVNLIESMFVTKNVLSIRACKELRDLFLIQDFIVEYNDPEIDLRQLPYSVITLPFVMHMLPIVWQMDKTYVVESIDADLYACLPSLKKVFRLFYQKINWQGSLEAREIIKNSYKDSPLYAQNARSVIIPFSGGVDSVYNSLVNLDKKQHLVSICGGDVPTGMPELVVSFKQHCQDYAERYNLPWSVIRSNFAGIYNDAHAVNHSIIWTLVTQGLSYTSLMLPLMIAKGIPFCLLGSASVAEHPWPYGSHPLIEHTLCAAGCYSFHFGGELTRSQKLAAINEICQVRNIQKPELRICWSKILEQKNCGICPNKCLITMLCLLVEGYSYEEFGLFLPHAELFERIKNTLLEHPLDHDTIFKWGVIQKRIAFLEPKKIPYQEDVQEFLSWFKNLDLCALRDKKLENTYAPNVKEVFASLWNASMEVAHKRFNALFS
ncbi:MAG: hypothetical protein AB7R69_01315 [Candidatus Babeliales bacterium]